MTVFPLHIDVVRVYSVLHFIRLEGRCPDLLFVISMIGCAVCDKVLLIYFI
jgi:hypothetical protein